MGKGVILGNAEVGPEQSSLAGAPRPVRLGSTGEASTTMPPCKPGRPAASVQGTPGGAPQSVPLGPLAGVTAGLGCERASSCAGAHPPCPLAPSAARGVRPCEPPLELRTAAAARPMAGVWATAWCGGRRGALAKLKEVEEGAEAAGPGMGSAWRPGSGCWC